MYRWNNGFLTKIVMNYSHIATVLPNMCSFKILHDFNLCLYDCFKISFHFCVSNYHQVNIPSNVDFSLQWGQFDVQCACKNVGRQIYWIISLSRTLQRCRAALLRKPARFAIYLLHPELLILHHLVVNSEEISSSKKFFPPFNSCVWAVMTTQRQRVTAWSVLSSCV